jgi:hypothetical protein
MILIIFLYLSFGVYLTLFIEKINKIEVIIGKINSGNAIFFICFYPIFIFIHFMLFIIESSSTIFEKIGKKIRGKI